MRDQANFGVEHRLPAEPIYVVGFSRPRRHRPAAEPSNGETEFGVLGITWLSEDEEEDKKAVDGQPPRFRNRAIEPRTESASKLDALQTLREVPEP